MTEALLFIEFAFLVEIGAPTLGIPDVVRGGLIHLGLQQGQVGLHGGDSGFQAGDDTFDPLGDFVLEVIELPLELDHFDVLVAVFFLADHEGLLGHVFLLQQRTEQAVRDGGGKDLGEFLIFKALELVQKGALLDEIGLIFNAQ